jgi:hypothetical protein
MSENTSFGFGKLVPGFDFLQNLAKGASQSMQQMPGLTSWVAPTLNVEELDKRIAELKAVQFWLDQNGKALAATIQALEVQKMTLATLQGMNFTMGELAEALTLKPGDKAAAKEKPAEATAARKTTAKPAAKTANKSNGDGAGAAAIDPLQWWGALTQQFQEIAANAMKDVATASAPSPQPASASAAKGAAASGTKKTAARKSAPRKTRIST